jgi:membrane associated rhomboid family serine protease
MGRYPVTAGSVVIAAVIFLFAGSAGADLLTLDVRAYEGEPWRILSTAFVHGGFWGEDSMYTGLMHFGFNAYWCLYLAPPLEQRWGHLRLASFIIAAATVSSVAEYAFLHTPVGLSGVVYAFAGARWYVEKQDPSFRPVLEARVYQLLGFWFVFCIGLTLSEMMPIANIAHGVGALMGVGLAAAGMGPTRHRLGAGLGLTLALGVYALAAPALRPAVNLGEVQGLDHLGLAERAFSKPDYLEAERQLKACLRYPRCPATANYNLGVAYARLGRLEDAHKAFAEAAEREPGNLTYSRERDELGAFLAEQGKADP